MKRLVLAMGLLVATLAGCAQTTTTQEPASCSGITCSRHGVCITDSAGFHCQCDQGYAASGGECLPEGPCSANPCTAPHQTVCISVGAVATCGCDDGYLLDADGGCVPADPCQPNPCIEPHRAACNAVGSTVVCSCDAGYWDHGECVPAVSCAPNPCTAPHQTVCTSDGTSATCSCDYGYLLDAEGVCVQFDPCQPSPCVEPHRTACQAVGSTAVCSCDEGYWDDGECRPEGPCSANPCTAPHQSVCISDGTSATCDCDDGYVLEADGACVPFDPCLPSPCFEPHRTACHAVGNTAVCSCDEGYWDHGGCVPAVSCSPNPCTEPNRSVCSSDGATVACGCDPGFVAVDGRCVVDDPCAPNPCTGLLRTVCRAAGTTAICSCDDGYREDARGNCVEACVPNPCTNPHQGDCAPAPGGFRCNCDEGYAMGLPTGTCLFDPPPDCAEAHGDGDSFEPDECPSLANLLVAPASVGHSIEGAGDVDWFAIDSTGDRVYLFEATSSSSSSSSNRLYPELSARGSDGVTVLGTSSTDFAFSSLARVVVSPVAGRFYLRVKANGYSPTGTGAYTLSLKATFDDFGNAASKASTLSTAVTLAGRIEYPSDEDWFVIAADAGIPLRFTVAGSSRVLVSLHDASVLSYPSQNSPLISSSDSSATSVVGWKPATSGLFYLRVRGYESTTPSYDLRVNEVLDDDADSAANATAIALDTPSTRALDYPGDVDWFTFTVPSNGVYTLGVQSAGSVLTSLFASSILTNYSAPALASDSDSSAALSVTLVEGQSYYVRVSPYYSGTLSSYTLRLVARGQDDHGDAASVATPLTVGQSSAGSIQFLEDQDWFSLRATPGHVYEARLSASSVSLMLVGSDGTTALQSSSSYSSSGALRFGFWDEGPYYLSVRSSSSSGSYSLTVEQIALDTAGNSATLAAGASTNTLIPGAIDHLRDFDWYSLQLDGGRIYEFSLIPSSLPCSIKLYGADASTQLGMASAASSSEAVVLRRAATSGVHYVLIAANDSYSSYGGAYAFQVTDLGLDDHGDAATAATVVTAGTPQAGRVQFGGDVDWLSLPTTENHSYRVTVTPLGFTLQARLVDPNGYTVLEDQKSYLPIVFQFSAASAAPHFLNLSAALANGVGSFTVDLEDLGQAR